MATEKRELEIQARLKDFVSKNLSTIGRTITKFGQTAGRAFRSLAARISPVAVGISGLVAAWAAFRGGRTVTEILQGVDALDKLGDSLNTDVGRLAILRGAFETAGIQGDKFADIMKTLGERIGSVIDRTDENLLQGFEALGITIEDIRRQDVVGLFEQIAGGLERYGDAQERAAALSRFFPENFQPLFAVLARGQGEFRQLIALSQTFVGTISEDGAKAAGRFATAMNLLRTAVESVGRDAFINLAERFAPTIERVATFLANNRKVIAEGLAAIVSAIVKVVAVVGTAILRVLAFVIERGDELVQKLAEIPLIGNLIASALEEMFDVPKLNERARAIRQEASGVADQLAEVEARIEALGRSPAADDPRGNRLAALSEQADELRGKLAALANQFETEAPNAGDLVQSSKTGASLRQLSDLLNQLANFRDLPGLPIEFEGILDQLFGPGGLPAAQQSLGDFFGGFGQQIEQIRRRWTDFALAGREAATRLVDGGLNRLSDTFADIITRTKSAKEAFRDLARALLSDLARILSRLLIVRAVRSIFGDSVQLEKGGVVQGTMSKPVKVGAFESGGIARGPTLALFGEGRASKGEAFVPLPDGRSIPVTMQGGGGGTTLNFHISAVDGQSVRRMLVEERGTISAILRDAVQNNQHGMRQVIQRATA